MKALFEQVEDYLQAQGYLAKGGQILDAKIVTVLKQHISKEEKQHLDQGEFPSLTRELPSSHERNC
ncbi:MAG: hypothetical protein MJA27_35695 [Pseudanabaenales cyanobacterium]|nr:hypothetical protein [Pseudanabaenales cyanobacterium]